MAGESRTRRHSGHVFEQDDGDKVLYASANAIEDGGLLKQKSAEAKASILHAGNGEDEADFLEAKAGAWKTDAGAGVSASVNLADVKAHGFEGKVGLGVDTGVGLKDDSVTAQVLGTGITVGRKMKVSVLGNEIGVDCGRIFGKCTAQVLGTGHLADVIAHGFEGKVGLGVDTGVGLKDDSVTAQVLGTGITVGRKMKVSVLGNEIGVDFGRIFGK